MSRTFNFQDKVIINLSDDGTQITLEKPKSKIPITIKGEPEEFATRLFTKLAEAKDKEGKPVFIVTREELEDCIKQFASFLKGEEFTLELEVPETPTKITETKPVVAVPITKFVEEEKKPTEKQITIPTVDASQLVMRFQELSKTIQDKAKIYDILEKEFNIAKEAIYQILPIPKEEIKREKLIEEAKLQPVPTPVTEETKIFSYTDIEGYEYITSKHLEWLDALTKVYGVDRDTLLKRYIKQAEKSKQKIKVKLGILIAREIFNDASKHNVIQFIRRRVYHLVFLFREGSELKHIECLADKNIEGLKINRCYRLPELNNLEARLIAMTFPPYLRDISSYSSDMKMLTKLEPIGDIPAIPIAGADTFIPITLREAIEKAKESPTKEIIDCIYVTIKQINEWEQRNGAFLAVHDGVDPDLPVYACKIKLPYDNPFGLDETIISNSVDKSILCYGILQYVEPRGKLSEGLIITPMFIGFTE